MDVIFNHEADRQMMIKTVIILYMISVSMAHVFAQTGTTSPASDTLRYLHIPKRAENARSGSEFARRITGLAVSEREQAVVNEILSGNVPSFARKLRPVTVSGKVKGVNQELTFYALCDYMAVGSDSDYLYMPMTPSTAQYLADKLGCTLPTKKMVDDIYLNAEIKLSPQPIPPSDKMTTVPVFMQHTDSIKQQISRKGFSRLLNRIYGGHKKDIILSNKIYSPDRNYERVVIYGWHRSVNDPIQPVYNGHGASYADYSHGVRLISRQAVLDSDSTRTDSLLTDADFSVLLSDEGPIARPRYPASTFLTSIGRGDGRNRPGFILRQNYPNPFNPSTTIWYQLAQSTTVELSIYNLLGKKITTLVAEQQSAGRYQVEWDGLSHASGVYIYRLNAGLFRESRRMLLLR
ncbi:MAG TPA: T9SS type A sorting domain-containing protein [Caldithrix abyssi]|uniref:T9SS type A sorting domain-containing protein n=1 Tax=Caldithrix abyssi TaxID=187145 RepID=A0A7V1LX69_CALAY|nr:T9SS type A sorting domain-containing protein [Caldithrix abyssi]